RAGDAQEHLLALTLAEALGQLPDRVRLIAGGGEVAGELELAAGLGRSLEGERRGVALGLDVFPIGAGGHAPSYGGSGGRLPGRPCKSLPGLCSASGVGAARLVEEGGESAGRVEDARALMGRVQRRPQPMMERAGIAELHDLEIDEAA